MPKKGQKFEICGICGKAIHSIPFRLNPHNTITRYNFAHKICYDKKYEKNNNNIIVNS